MNENLNTTEQNNKKKISKNKPLIIGSAITVILIILIALGWSFIRWIRYDQYHNDAPVEESANPQNQFATTQTGKSYDDNSISNFSVNGIQYTLPEKVTEFLEHGWELDNPDDTGVIITSNGTYSLTLNFSGAEKCSTKAYVINHSIDSQPLSKCMIYQISFSDEFAKNSGAEITLCKNSFKLTETPPEKVKSVLGKATLAIIEDKSVKYRYEAKPIKDREDLYTTYCFDNDVLSSVTIRNKLKPENFVQPEVTEQTPDFINEYQAPSSLGDDIISGNYSLNGVLYNFPTPLKELTANGWTYDSETEPIAPSRMEKSIKLKNGNSTMEIETYNPLPTATTLDNSIVTRINVEDESNCELILPGNIEIGLPKKDLFDVVKEHGNPAHLNNARYREYEIYFNISDKSSTPKEYIFLDFGNYDDAQSYISYISLRRYGSLKNK